jgi:Tfp pilus assembly protein PilF
VGLVVLTFAVFGRVAGHDFVDWDDLAYIVENPHVNSGASLRGALEAFTVPHDPQWTPLSRISLQLGWTLHGGSAPAFLLTNVALHALASAVLFLALARMTASPWPSAFVAAVFAVHPLHVESVAWAAERKDVLSGLFFVLALIAHARFAERPGAGRYAVVLLAFGIGLLAKSMLVTLPLVLLLLDAWPLRRLSWRAVREKLPMFALAGVVGAIVLAVQHSVGTTQLSFAIPLGARVANAIDSYAVYLADSFWPSGLSPFYPHPLSSLPALRVAGGAALLVAVSTCVALAGRRRPYLAVGWLWFVATLLPVIGLVQVGMQARADRYMYIPSIGLAIMLAFGVEDLAGRRRRVRVAAAVAGCAVVAALAVAAWIQVGYWRDSDTLWGRALALAPDSALVHQRIATLRIREGRLDEAERHYREAFRLDPDHQRTNLVRFHLGMAHSLAERGEIEAARTRLLDAVALDPEHARANALLGIALEAEGRPAEALPHLLKALESIRDSAQLHLVAASALRALGRSDEAELQAREARRLEAADGSDERP